MSDGKSGTSWLTIFWRSAALSAVAVTGAFFVRLPVISFMGILFSVGFLAGAWGRRQGWLSGFIVGFPFSIMQVSSWAGPEGMGADFWRLAVPAAFIISGMAVLGGMSGAWLRDMKLQRDA
jgi:hypothetical protein